MIRGRREELLYQALPWGLGVGVFLTSFLAPMQTPWGIAGGDYALWIGYGYGFWVVALALASGVTAAMAQRRVWPLFVVAAVAWLTYSMWPAMVAASFYAATRSRQRWRAGLYLVLSTLLVVVPIFAGTGRVLNGVRFAAVMIALMIVVPFTGGLWVRTRRQLIDELRARNATLAAQARAQERTRIAREMHDVVAHRVAMIVLHAGGLELVTKEERTRQEAELIRTTGREALNELRHLLGVLREPGEAPGPQPLLEDIDRLVEQTRQAGIEVVLTVEGDLAGLPVTVERGAYRLVQEALTNVVKHAPGARAEVLLRNDSGTLEVTVLNGPARSIRAEALPSGKLGLIGLRERIDLLGGEFKAGPLADGGFRVSARMATRDSVLQLPGEDVRRAV